MRDDLTAALPNGKYATCPQVQHSDEHAWRMPANHGDLGIGLIDEVSPMSRWEGSR